MTDKTHEQLSALLDGELSATEAPMAVRRIARDEALREAALRYSLIGDAMRDELPAGRPADLARRIRRRLEQEPAGQQPADMPALASSRETPGRRIARLAGGFAVAASVALVALVALPGGQQDSAPPVISATDVASPNPAQRVLPPAYTRAAGGGAPDRLTRYYVNHSEYAPAVSGRGTLTRIIVIQPEAAPGGTAAEPVTEPVAQPGEESGNAR